MHGKQLASPLTCCPVLETNQSPKLETMPWPELEADDWRNFAEHCRPDSSTEPEGLQTTASFSENAEMQIEVVHFVVLRYDFLSPFLVSEKTRVRNESIGQKANCQTPSTGLRHPSFSHWIHWSSHYPSWITWFCFALIALRSLYTKLDTDPLTVLITG